jgi:predicted lipoprotein with Yx(FWY)xxD motif
MRSWRSGIAIIVAFVLVGAAAALTANGSAAPATTVATGPSGLGRILVDGRGRTLYLFEKDRRGTSSCAGLCATYWPPQLTNGKSVAGKGVRRALLGRIRRGDGTHQVTYAGHPLYVFSGDARRGQTNGEGLTDFGAGWYAVSPAGKKIDRD